MEGTAGHDALAMRRREIDALDAKLLELLNQRAEISLEVGRIKRASGDAGTLPVHDPIRERQLLARLAEINRGPLASGQIRAIWTEIMSASRRLQRPQKAAYLGPEGTFSHIAAIEFLGHSAEFCACPSFDAVFRCVQDGECDAGVVPLENSLQGTVGQNFDLLWRYDLCIRAEFASRIRHSLLSPENDLGNVRVVYSHPQPLVQCGRWLRENLPLASLVPVSSTAAAAERAAGERGCAAIGHCTLGERFGLATLASGIEDEPINWTRFVLLVPKDSKVPAGRADKTSVLFTLPDKAGALASVLAILAVGGINMRKLESRPLPGECWKYMFFADLEADLGGEYMAPIVARLKEACLTFRILGSYASSMNPDDRRPGGRI
ncbi:MAG: prephenate dehydratase [Desulfovibrionaceae bacterium]|nr:prephenate dehydratase [Desulfovibrionaceae bacterium]